ncbi:MAG: hypothetical protein ACRDP1_01885 [Nocardioidaceae bacterium]
MALGTAAAAGVLFKSTATEPVTLTANGSGNSRLDLVYAQINWAAGTGSIGALAGVPAPTPTLPALTQTAGTTWQIPLASCLVRSGVVDLTAHPGDLVDARPLYSAVQVLHRGGGMVHGGLLSVNTDSSGTALIPHGMPQKPSAAVVSIGATGQAHLTCAVTATDTTNITVFVRRSSDDVAATSAGVGLWWMALAETYT